MAAGVSEYIERVETDGGEVESDIYVSESVEDLGDFFDDASLVNIPTAYKATKLYSIKPTDGSGDFTFARSTTATRVNESGLIESVGVNVPRINYSSGVPSLLLEPQRTNLLSQSNDFSGWTIVNGTLTSNFASSPDGTTNASKINFTTGGELYQTTILTSGATYTLSFYAKVSSGTFDFTFGNIDNTLTSGTATTEWQRFEVTQVAASTSQDIKLDATDTGDLLIYGFQVEAGRYATSYIPTSGASVTRTADNTSATGVSGLIGQTEGTIYSEVYFKENGLSTNWLSLSDGTSNNWVFVGKDGDDLRAYVRASNTVAFSNQDFQIVDDALAKVALSYKSGDIALYINGTQIATSSSAFSFNNTLDSIYFGLYNSGSGFESRKQNKLLLFKTRLSNTELTTLTTL